MLNEMEGIQHAFFEAMAHGYAQDVKKATIPAMPYSKVIPFKIGDYRVSDFYLSSQFSDMSSGQTIIWHKGVPVWTMHYGGRYAEIAIPFLKECLNRAYVKERRFYGGRGPYFVQEGRFTYVNRIVRESFANFEGEERIYDLSEQCFGYHWYRGMSLLKRGRGGVI
jgi:hypothetical protein